MANFSFSLFCNKIRICTKALYIQVLHTVCFKESNLFILPQFASFPAYHKSLLSFSHMVTTVMKTEIRKLIRSLNLFKIRFLVILKFYCRRTCHRQRIKNWVFSSIWTDQLFDYLQLTLTLNNHLPDLLCRKHLLITVLH